MQPRPDYLEAKALLTSDAIALSQVADFLENVYIFGCYAESAAYTRAARAHVKTIDAKIVELAVQCAMVKSHTSLRELVFQLADVRANIDGHHWRAERIFELGDKRRAI